MLHVYRRASNWTLGSLPMEGPRRWKNAVTNRTAAKATASIALANWSIIFHVSSEVEMRGIRIRPPAVFGLPALGPNQRSKAGGSDKSVVALLFAVPWSIASRIMNGK